MLILVPIIQAAAAAGALRQLVVTSPANLSPSKGKKVTIWDINKGVTPNKDLSNEAKVLIPVLVVANKLVSALVFQLVSRLVFRHILRTTPHKAH